MDEDRSSESLSRAMREMRAKKAAEEAAAAARAAEEAQAAAGGDTDEEDLKGLHPDLPGAAELTSPSTALTAESPSPPQPTIDHDPNMAETDGVLAEMEDENGIWVPVPGAWVRPAPGGGAPPQAAQELWLAPTPSVAPDSGTASIGGESAVFKEARRIAAERRAAAPKAAQPGAPASAPSDAGAETAPPAPDAPAPEAAEPAPPHESPEETAAREAAEAAAEDKNRKEKADQRYINGVQRVYQVAISEYLAFLEGNPNIAQLESYLSDLVKRHLNTLEVKGISMFYQASAAKVVATLEGDIIPGIKRFTQENLKAIFVNSRIPEKWILPLSTFLGEMVQNKLRDRSFNMHDFLERVLAHLESSARRDGTFGPEEEAFLDKYAEDMQAAHEAEEARLARGGRPDDESTDGKRGKNERERRRAPLTPEEIEAAEKRDLLSAENKTTQVERSPMSGGSEFFIERIDITDETLRELHGGDEAELNAKLALLEAKYGRKVSRVARGESRFPGRGDVYYLEYFVLDKADCKILLSQHANTCSSLVVKLVGAGRFDDFTLDELTVLRTFDKRLLKETDPNKGKVDEHGKPIEDTSHVDFILEYFHKESKKGGKGGDIQTIYQAYRRDLSSLFHILSAFAQVDTDEKPSGRVKSLDEVVAGEIISRLKDVSDGAKDIPFDQRGEVKIMVPKTVEERKEVPIGVSAHELIDNRQPQVEWASELREVHRAFEEELRPTLESISEVLGAANTARERTHTPDVPISVIVDLSKRVDSKKMGYVLRSLPILNDGLQKYMLGLQLYGASRHRLIGSDFGMRNPSTKREDAEDYTLGLVKADLLAEQGNLAEGTKVGRSGLTPRNEALAEYVALFGSGGHKLMGEYWNYLASLVSNEMMTATDDKGGQVLPRDGAISPVVQKLLEICPVEDEMYGKSVSAIDAVPVNRYFGWDKGFKMVSEQYQVLARKLAAARRIGASGELLEIMRSKIFLPKILQKQVGDVLSMGGWRTPALQAELKQLMVTAPDGPASIRYHEHIMDGLRVNWGTRGVINYIEENIEALMKADPEYSSMMDRLDAAKGDAQAGRPVDNAQYLSTKERVIGGVRWFFGKEDPEAKTKQSLTENVRRMKDKARAKFLKEYVYTLLLDEKPSMAILLENALLSDEEELVRQTLQLWVADRLRVLNPGVRFTISDLNKTLRALELMAIHRDNERLAIDPSLTSNQQMTIRMNQIRIISESIGLRKSDEELQGLLKLSEDYYDRLMQENSTRDLAGELALAHAQDGAINSQMTSNGLDYAKVLAMYLDMGILSGINSRKDIKKARNELFGEGGILDKSSGLRPGDPEKVASAAKTIAEKIKEISGLITQNPLERMRIHANLTVIAISALIDDGSEGNIYGSGPTFLTASETTTLRFYLLRTMAGELGIPGEEFIKSKKADGSSGLVLSPVVFNDVARELGIMYPERFALMESLTEAVANTKAKKA